ncbi:Lon protease family protein [Halalkalibaculum sp. DA384]|uniref:Lon protease family protein n=1 Tax=Halalkalibaculum sp. DA384 TaxID=3373606 RepID=UPI003754C94A
MNNKSMLTSNELSIDKLYRNCNPEDFTFSTTDELEPLEQQMIGQDRALASANFGIRMHRDGYNIYALGAEETDKRNLLELLIKSEAENQEVPADWSYVCNFGDEHQPIALQLPAGKAARLRTMMESLADDLPNVLTSAFESEEYQNRRQTIEEQLKEEEQTAFSELQQRAVSQGLTLITTPVGYSFAPTKDNRLMTREEMQQLTGEERKAIEEQIQIFQKELQKVLRQVPERQRKFRAMREKLNKEFTQFSVRGLLEEIEAEFSGQPKVLEYLKHVQDDIVEHVEGIINPGGTNPFIQAMTGKQETNIPSSEHPVLWRYGVNVMIDNATARGAPVIYEDNPTYNNLIGRIEHVSEMGTLTTDFTFIRPGALHRANGGYLLVDALRLLTQPFAWEGLKRALQSNQLKVESPGDMYGLFSTVTLQPAAIDLDVKVVLIGSRFLYYLLCAYDPDFMNLFKVEVDFEDEIDWNSDNQHLYARLIAGLLRKYNLSPMDRGAVSRMIEHTSRMVSDNEKVSTHIQKVIDLLREADFWAGQDGKKVIGRDAVQQAIEQQIYRSGRLRDRIREEMIRKNIFIDTEGSKVGQVNGLSVVMLGNSMFGHPTRITARVQLGRGQVINIEREVEMSGPIHSKGVLILSSFLGARYASEKPLSLNASLVFEQSYGGVEGDSASSTELYALLSAIGEIPLKQSIAVTGSVNQHGEIQPIGGVNEKIEGFFDLCNERGLTGEQGVLIPRANVKNLMLKHDVVQAVEKGRFHIYPVETIDAGMELLTDLEMGRRNIEGRFPKGSINQLVEEKLDRYAAIRQQYAMPGNGLKQKEESNS